jgi:small-conductance mechanosensitive channel
MRISLQIKVRLFQFLLIFIFTGGQYLQGQTKTEAPSDTSKTRRTVIDLGDIPIRAAEITNKTWKDIHDMIPDGTIHRLEAKNALAIATINPNLLTDVDPNDVSKNIRFLENRKIELIQEQRKIEDMKAELSAVLASLDSFKNKLSKESRLWKNTWRRMERDSLTVQIPVKLTETIFFIDSTLQLIAQKSNLVLDILDKNIATGEELDSQIEQTKELILTKQSQVFMSDHISFFKLDFITAFGKEIVGSLGHMKEVDLVDLKEYLRKSGNPAFITLLLFIGLIWLFRNIKKKVYIQEAGYGYFYKDILLKVLSHPVSASVVLTLVATLFIFQSRPVIFREISFYVIAFPLMHILTILLHKKYHLYIYAFGVLILFNLTLIFLLSDSVIYRMMLLFISLAEITLFTLFLKYFETKRELDKLEKRLIYSFVYLHLALAGIGFFANLAGRIILTEIVLNAVFLNIFNGLILLITALLLNGLVATGIDTGMGQKLNVFRMHGEVIKRKTIYLFNFLAVLTWLILVLRNFRISEYVFGGIASIITRKIPIGFASFSLDGILVFFLVIYIAIVLSNIIRILLEEDVLVRFSLSKGLPHTAAMLAKYALITAGFFLAVNAAGIPMDKLTIILGAMSVGIGFGLQNIFNNLVSGLILLFERPIQLGDTVQVGQLTGNVKTIGLRSSNITTFEGAEVIVPNGQLISNEVINWTLSDQKRRIEIVIGVAYKSDPEEVYRILSEILNNHKELVTDPEPLVFFNGLGESSLDFTLLFWIGDYIHNRRIRSEILFSVFRLFKENNIEIPFPQHDLHLRSVDPEILLQQSSLSKKKD